MIGIAPVIAPRTNNGRQDETRMKAMVVTAAKMSDAVRPTAAARLLTIPDTAATATCRVIPINIVCRSVGALAK